MKSIEANYKTIKAIRNAYNLIGGEKFDDGTTYNLFKDEFNEDQLEHPHPFQLRINYDPLSGHLLEMYEGIFNVFVDSRSYWIDTPYRGWKAVVNLDTLHDLPTSYPNTLMPNTPSSTMWSLVFYFQANERQFDQKITGLKVPQMCIVKEEYRNGTSNSSASYPDPAGLHKVVIGTFTKTFLSGATSQYSPSAYWSVSDQFINSNLDIYLGTVFRNFAIRTNISDMNPISDQEFRIGNQLEYGNFTYKVSKGWLNYVGHQIEVPAIEVDADEFPEPSGSHYLYLHFDIENLSAYMEFESEEYKDWPMLSGGIYSQYLGKIEQYETTSGLIMNVASQWTGPIYISNYLPEDEFPDGSNCNFTYVEDDILKMVPMSAGFIQAVPTYPSGTIYHDITFVPSGKCEEEN